MGPVVQEPMQRLDQAALDRLAERAARLLGMSAGEVVRFEGVARASLAGAWAGPGTPSPSPQMRTVTMALHPGGVHDLVQRSGRPARIADDARNPDPVSQLLASLGLRCAMAVPIMVDGRLWGSLGVSSERPRGVRWRSRHLLAEVADEIGATITV